MIKYDMSKSIAYLLFIPNDINIRLHMVFHAYETPLRSGSSSGVDGRNPAPLGMKRTL